MIQNFWQRIANKNRLNDKITKMWFKKIDDKKLFSVQKGTEGIING